MRGEQQDVTMSDAVLTEVMGKVSEIGNLLFTGGEPSLAVDKIWKTYDLAQHFHVNVGSVCVVTNARRVTDQFLSALDRWKNIAENLYISVSRDQFHGKVDEDNIYRLQRCLGLDDSQFVIQGAISKFTILDEGRAYWNGIGSNDVHPRNNGPEWDEEGDYTGELYVNALGEIIDGGDWSFDSQSDWLICNVHDDIEKRLKQYYEDDWLRHMIKTRPLEVV
jgi:hypothetical protein